MGNRKLNAALHQVVLTQARVHPPARACLAKKRAEGRSNKEAFRCLKRHLVRVVWRVLREHEDTANRVEQAIGAALGQPHVEDDDTCGRAEALPRSR